MRRPVSDTVCIDANILLSAAFGVMTDRYIRAASVRRALVMSDVALGEAQRIVRRLADDERAEEALAAYVRGISVIPFNQYQPNIEDAMETIYHAPASGGGDRTDAHVLAVAWLYDADIWSHDRDFAGIGWPVWSSRNLLSAL